MSLTQYYTAATLDGYIADPDHSLAWLLTRDRAEHGLLDYGDFIAGVGAVAMGATTYEWILEHGSGWPYAVPSWVFTHRDLPASPDADVRFVSGDVRPVHEELARAAGDRNVWLVGGGDLVGQFADPLAFYRELGFPLEQIVVLLDDPAIDAQEHLSRQHDLLIKRIERLTEMVTAVERAMEAEKMGINLTPEERHPYIDIGRAHDVLKSVLGPLNYQNLDAMPQLKGVNTTTEFITKHVFDALAAAARAGSLGRDGRAIASIRVTVAESPVARAWYEAPVW